MATANATDKQLGQIGLPTIPSNDPNSIGIREASVTKPQGNGIVALSNNNRWIANRIARIGMRKYVDVATIVFKVRAMISRRINSFSL